MANWTATGFFVFLCAMSFSAGFDLTLDHQEHDSSKSRDVCGIVRCTEMLADVHLSGDPGNQTRQLTSFSVYKTRLSGDGTRGRWQQLASLTPRQPDLDRVSGGVRITGQLSNQQATLSLELAKPRDCQESQFCCVAVFTDSQGRTSVKKSLVGKALDAHGDFGPQFQGTSVSPPTRKVRATDGQSGSVGTLAQLVNLLQEKFDRMEDSLKYLENRLEDKVGNLRAAVHDEVSGLDSHIEARFGTQDLKMNNLQNRLEDKLVHLDTRVTEVMGQTKRADSDNGGTCDRLAAKVDGLEVKQEDNRKQLDTCVAEVIKLSKGNDNIKQNLSDQLTSVAASLQFIERNFTSSDGHPGSPEAPTGQCAIRTTGNNDRLTDLASSVTSLSDITLDLVSRVNTFRAGYGSGALVPVEEFFDLLDTGEKEWRLAFRGTPYINVQVYPAYMHGTGIPAEVEEGCKQFNRSLPCANHYRNRDAFDSWAGVDEVLFAIYKDDQIVQRVIFNGRGSSYTSWFTEGRVIDSSWDDLITKSHLHFSMTGDSTATTKRRIYISHDHHGGCSGFRGWFLAGDTNVGCPVENTVSYPTFFYATGKTFAAWTSADAGQADAFGIFLKYE